MGDLIVGLSLDDREDLVLKFHGDLVHSKCHRFNVKYSGFGALGKKI